MMGIHSSFEMVQNPLAAGGKSSPRSSVTGSSGSYSESVGEEEIYVEPCVHAGKGESSVAGATANLVNCVVGAGIVGLPAAVSQCGFVMGGICLIAVAYLLYCSAIYLVQCGEKLGKHNFESLAEHLFGRFGYYATTSSMAVFAYGGMTAYMVILGDTLPPVIALISDDKTFSSREFLVLFSATFVMLPICMLKSLSDMVWASTVSVLADLAIIIIILIEGPTEARQQGIEMDSSHISFIKPGIFAGIGTMSFAFVCHHNSFIIYKSLKEPSLENWSMVARYTAYIALLFALALALGGYCIFNDHVEGDILNNFEGSGAAVMSGKVLLALCMVLTYPVECFIARHCVNSVIDYYRSRPYDNLNAGISSDKSDGSHETDITQTVGQMNPISNTEQDDVEVNLYNQHASESLSSSFEAGATRSCDGSGPDGNSKLTITNVTLRGDHSFFRSDTWHVIITLLLWGSSTLLSLVFTDLDIVLSFTGCIAASNLGYILPAILYFGTYKEEYLAAIGTCTLGSPSYEPEFLKRLSNIQQFVLPATLFIFGICVMFIGLATIIYNGSEESEA